MKWLALWMYVWGAISAFREIIDYAGENEEYREAITWPQILVAVLLWPVTRPPVIVWVAWRRLRKHPAWDRHRSPAQGDGKR
ncbi:MAG: hypothetical protein AB7I42_26615 [Bradyrhizobium sp.]|uniref:hypothetical protein n=1 Tax=Bradyrhizobium sp. TaxID=376 RepID=UPI003D10066B